MAEENTGGAVSSTAMALSGDAAISLSLASETAPASMSSWGVPRDSTAVRCSGVSVTVRRHADGLPARPDSVAPPVFWPGSRTCSLSRWTVPLRDSLKVIASWPLPVE